MKKLTFFAAALAIVSLTSCKKDYECSCNGTFTMDMGFGASEESTIPPQTYTIESVKEDEAEDQCNNEYETQFKNTVGLAAAFGDIEYDVNCSVSEK